MYLKQKIPRSSFMSFFDDFRYAGATIVALCSQGLKSLFCASLCWNLSGLQKYPKSI
jgi:hypothetical protein